MQRSISPQNMSPENTVHYTRTGRISKAKKGLKVHHCDCGRVSYMFIEVQLASITSSDPDEGQGDGDQPHDIQAVNGSPVSFGTDVRSFLLRAER